MVKDLVLNHIEYVKKLREKQIRDGLALRGIEYGY